MSKKRVWSRLIVLMALCAAILVGCQLLGSTALVDTNEEEAVLEISKIEEHFVGEATEEGEPLLVFQVGSRAPIIKDYQAAFPDVELEVHLVNSATRMDSAIEKYGEPDLIIDMSGRNMERWVNEGYAKDISALYDTDTSYNPDDYYPNVEKIGQVDMGLYGFPLGLGLPYMTIRDEMWQESAFSKLGDNYTPQELLNAWEEELDYWLEQDIADMYYVFNIPMMDVWINLWNVGAIQFDGEQVKLDQELFEQLCRVQEKAIIIGSF